MATITIFFFSPGVLLPMAKRQKFATAREWLLTLVVKEQRVFVVSLPSGIEMKGKGKYSFSKIFREYFCTTVFKNA